MNFDWNKLMVLNPEFPNRHFLTDEHAEKLLKSGIDREAACYAGIFSVTADEAFQWTGHRHGGLLYPYLQPNGNLMRWGDGKPFARLNPDNPKVPKYLSPAGAGLAVYIPRAKSIEWTEGDRFKSGLNLIVTEGEKKALAAAIHGFHALGLGGIDCWFTGEKKPGSNQRELGFFLDDLNLLSQQSVIIVFDADPQRKILEGDKFIGPMNRIAHGTVAAYTKKERQTVKTPTKTLKLQHILKYALLPKLPGRKIGLDDALLEWGALPVGELLENALPLCQLSPDGDDINTTCCYSGEPLSDFLKTLKGYPYNLQAFKRSIIGWLQTKNQYMNVPLLGWYRYGGEIWEAITEDQWKSLPQIVFDAQNWKNRNGTTTALFDLINYRLTVEKKEVDVPRYLAFKNGVLDRETLALHEFSHEFKLTQQVGFDYNPDADCPYFKRWLQFVCASPEGDSWNDESESCVQKMQLIRALFAFTLTPRNKGYGVEIFPYIWGPPKRGKGTLVEILTNLCGNAYASWSIESLTNPNALSLMENKLASICTEVKGVFSSEALAAINKISTNEPIVLKRLYKDVYTGRTNTVLWAAANEMMAMKSSDSGGVGRRALYIEFARPVENYDPNHKALLMEELSGIYNWAMTISYDEAIQIVIDYHHTCEYIESQRQYLLESNSVYAWIVEADDGTDNDWYCQHLSSIPLNQHYQRYQKWGEKSQVRTLTKRRFAKQLRLAGAIIIDSNSIRSFSIPAPKSINVLSLSGN